MVKLQIDPQRYYFVEFEVSSLYDSYGLDGKLGAT